MRTSRKWWPNLIMIFCGSMLTTFVALVSCEKESIVPEVDRTAVEGQIKEKDIYPVGAICGDQVKKKVLLKNGKEAGYILLFNDSKYFYVQATASRDYHLRNAYLYTGTFDEIPRNVFGDPNLGRFPYKSETDSYSSTRKFRIPLSDLKAGFVVSFMVEVKPTFAQGSLGRPLKAWAEGRFYGTKELGTAFSHEKNICAQIDPISVNE